jgi:hypothetical protein
VQLEDVTPMTVPKLPINDGFTDLEYDLGPDADQNARLTHILNEACHVFHYHACGTWQEHDKDAYAQLLAEELRQRPGLVGRLLNTDDRVVKMITYRAVELHKLAQASEQPSQGSQHLSDPAPADPSQT